MMKIVGGLTSAPVAPGNSNAASGTDNAVAAAMGRIVARSVAHAAGIFGVTPPALTSLPGSSAGEAADGNPDRDVVRSATTALGNAIGIAPMRERDLYAALDEFARKAGVLAHASPYRLQDIVELIGAEIAAMRLEAPSADQAIAAITRVSQAMPDQVR